MRVLSLHHYPVKSLRGLSVDALTFDERGPVDDRRWLVIDEAGQFLTQRTVPGMARLAATVSNDALTLRSETGQCSVARAHAGDVRPVVIWRDTVAAIDCGDHAAQWLTTALGRPCRLVRLPDDSRRLLDPAYSPRADAHTGFADAYPALVTTMASLAALNERLDTPIPMQRFRPNVVLDGEAAFAEDHWGVVQLGAIAFDAVKPCVRCAVITTDQVTGARDAEPLRVLSQLNLAPKKGAVFGMNLVHRAPGMLRVGDDARVEQRLARPDWGK